MPPSNPAGRTVSPTVCRGWQLIWFAAKSRSLPRRVEFAAALAAKAVTTTIPIVFTSGDDPIKLGLVTSLNRPEGNLTGISWFNTELAAKRLALLLEIAPAATSVVLLADPNNRESEPQVGSAQDAARTLGRRFTVLNASTPGEIDAAFASLVQQRAGALIVASGPFFVSRREQIIALAMQYAIPTMYSGREFPLGGWPDELRKYPCRCLPPQWHLRRPYSQGR